MAAWEGGATSKPYSFPHNASYLSQVCAASNADVIAGFNCTSGTALLTNLGNGSAPVRMDVSLDVLATGNNSLIFMPSLSVDQQKVLCFLSQATNRAGQSIRDFSILDTICSAVDLPTGRTSLPQLSFFQKEYLCTKDSTITSIAGEACRINQLLMLAPDLNDASTPQSINDALPNFPALAAAFPMESLKGLQLMPNASLAASLGVVDVAVTRDAALAGAPVVSISSIDTP
jgi:hypothetical protein